MKTTYTVYSCNCCKNEIKVTGNPYNALLGWLLIDSKGNFVIEDCNHGSAVLHICPDCKSNIIQNAVPYAEENT